ncbi:hypothetical protein ACIQU5_21880 [Streptomyces sp. NPDC090306]|uniref:hypothetical protein n=1 Tax=unclassified Streptomyces TaxID=2593676 RepID=UPI0036ECEC1E
MHSYDVPRRQSLAPIPAARPGRDPRHVPSATPIYDALYAEYVRSFRALPGDRSGEEELDFAAFGTGPQGIGHYHPLGSGSYGGGHGTGSYSSYSAYSAGAHSARQGQPSAWQRVGTLGQLDGQQNPTTASTGVWQAGGRQHGTGMHHVPAPLPPGPRRGN